MRQEETSGVATPEGDASLCLQGVNHLALNTDNMRTTLEFYTRVLGMRLVHAGRALEPVDLSGQPLDRSATGQPPHADVRHYMLDMGGGSMAFDSNSQRVYVTRPGKGLRRPCKRRIVCVKNYGHSMKPTTHSMPS